MKKALIYFTMIVGIIAIIGACKKSEDDSSTSATCAGMTVEAVTCLDTPAGSITGIDNSSWSGVYDTYHAFGIAGTAGFDNTTGCISSAALVAVLGGPTGTASVIANRAVTSSSSIAHRFKYYSDTSCSTEIATISFGMTDVTVGDNVTGLSTSVDGTTYPSSATKVEHTSSCVKMKASNAAGVTYLDNLFGGALDIEAGTEYSCQNSGDKEYFLINVWDTSALSVGTDSILYVEESDSAYPTDWTDDADTLTKLP